jgi:hypothetical protein
LSSTTVSADKGGSATSGPLVPAGPARAHVEALRAAGGGTRAIAVAAGVARTSVRDVVSGRTERIREGTSRGLLAVTVDDVTGHVLVDAAPTLALIAHLVDDFGCSPAWIAAQLGSKPAGRRLRLQVGCRQLVRARTARAVAELAARVEQGGGPVDGVGETSDKETPR